MALPVKYTPSVDTMSAIADVLGFLDVLRFLDVIGFLDGAIFDSLILDGTVIDCFDSGIHDDILFSMFITLYTQTTVHKVATP